MRNLQEISLEDYYDSGAGDLVDQFYVPCLRNSTYYDRAVGYFRSSLYILVGVAFSDFASANGKMRLVCSTALTRDDVKAIQEGLSTRSVMTAVLKRDLDEMVNDPHGMPVVQLLATMVAMGSLDILIANKPGSTGIFHNKVGIFRDSVGNSVSFIGSSNDTYSGWHPTANHEGFEVFRSWRSQIEVDRVQRHKQYFESLWTGVRPGIQTIPLPTAVREHLIRYQNPRGFDAAADEVKQLVRDPGWERRRIRQGGQGSMHLTLMAHQRAALESWTVSDHKGIVKHATGSGKTFTAISGIRSWLERGGPALVFVPSSLLAHQWVREATGVLQDIDPAILMVGAGFQRREWEAELPDFTRNLPELGPRLVISTMQSGATDTFLQRIQGGSHLLIVADEVHRIGSPRFRRILGIDAGARLGLSATPERYGDPEGTQHIRDYFGAILEPEFSLQDAIQSGRLVPYDYYIHDVALTDDEQTRWDELTERVGQVYQKLPRDASGTRVHTEQFRWLLIQRARILKQAVRKPQLADEILSQHFTQGDRWLVYCDDTAQLNEVLRLLNARNLPAFEYHSAMTGSATATLAYFGQAGGIVVAIRCLDEGVDIPAADHALILASSSNPREFIQRRGRVLRAAEGKFSAKIHDALVFPALGCEDRKPILTTELSRASTFADGSRNAATTHVIRRMARKAGIRVADLEMNSFEEERDDTAE
jgi:superfamily II DNA or RNA helicase